MIDYSHTNHPSSFRAAWTSFIFNQWWVVIAIIDVIIAVENGDILISDMDDVTIDPKKTASFGITGETKTDVWPTGTWSNVIRNKIVHQLENKNACWGNKLDFVPHNQTHRWWHAYEIHHKSFIYTLSNRLENGNMNLKKSQIWTKFIQKMMGKVGKMDKRCETRKK